MKRSAVSIGAMVMFAAMLFLAQYASASCGCNPSPTRNNDSFPEDLHAKEPYCIDHQDAIGKDHNATVFDSKHHKHGKARTVKAVE